MAGISDSGAPDDIKLHIETALSGDDAAQDAPKKESVNAKLHRESAQLPKDIRTELEAVHAAMTGELPGLTAAETAKLIASKAGRAALDVGKKALARIDDHLFSVTGERDPILGKHYGVYGPNPESFAGVYRSLQQSVTENERVSKLKPNDDGRRALFTPLIEKVTTDSLEGLMQVLGTRVETRTALATKSKASDATIKRAEKILTRVRQHLYANLPDQKQDSGLRAYGFEPIAAGGGRPKKAPPAPAPNDTTTK